MTGHTLHLADNQTILPALPDASIDTIMTDPTAPAETANTPTPTPPPHGRP